MHPFFFFFLFSIEKGESVLTKIKIYTINEMMGADSTKPWATTTLQVFFP